MAFCDLAVTRASKSCCCPSVASGAGFVRRVRARSVPLPLRYWLSSSQSLTAQMHAIIRTTIAQYDVNQAVKRGVERQQVQPGSVTFIQRCGGALNLHVHFHWIFLEGVYLDRAEAGLTPRFVKGEP